MGISQEVELIAHRGESFDAPENTLAAIKLAWERGADAVEVDVHLTADGEVIVCHDASTKRTCGVDLAIRNSTLSQLRELDAGSWKDRRFATEKLPTLAEVLATLPQEKRCFIEIKSGAEIVPPLMKAIEASGKRPQQIVIISFHEDALVEVKRQMPRQQCYYLSSPKKDEKTGRWSPSVPELIATAKRINSEALNLNYGFVDENIVAQIHAAGLECYVWTCDDPAAAKKLLSFGVDGITTNRAAWMKEQLRME